MPWPPLLSTVGVDHGGAHVIVTQQLLDGADVLTALKQVRREGVRECMTTNMLDHRRLADGLHHGPLKNGLMDVVPPLLPCSCVLPSVLLREYPLPAPVGGGVGVLAVQGVGHQASNPLAVRFLGAGAAMAAAPRLPQTIQELGFRRAGRWRGRKARDRHGRRPGKGRGWSDSFHGASLAASVYKQSNAPPGQCKCLTGRIGLDG